MVEISNEDLIEGKEENVRLEELTRTIFLCESGEEDEFLSI